MWVVLRAPSQNWPWLDETGRFIRQASRLIGVHCFQNCRVQLRQGNLQKAVANARPTNHGYRLLDCGGRVHMDTETPHYAY